MLAALSPVAYAPTVAPAPAATRAAVSMSFGDDFTVEARPWTSNEISDAAGLEALAKKLSWMEAQVKELTAARQRQTATRPLR